MVNRTIVTFGPYAVPSSSEEQHVLVVGPQRLLLPSSPAYQQVVVVQGLDANGSIDFGSTSYTWAINPGQPETGIWDFSNMGMSQSFLLYWDGTLWHWMSY